MATTEHIPVVGVFTEAAQVDLAVNALMQAGIPNERIKLARSENSPDSFVGVSQFGTGSVPVGFTDRVKNLFSGEKSTKGIVDDLTKIGIPEDEARYYQDQLDLGRIIMTIEAGDRREVVLGILHQYGAYDVSTRPDNAAPNA